MMVVKNAYLTRKSKDSLKNKQLFTIHHKSSKSGLFL